MQEQFLHFVWRYRRFDVSNLTTTTGEPIEILAVGEHNSNAGPDFLNARVRISDTLWAGNVELHVQASAWQQHGHTADAAYRNVVLHVVFEDDAPVFNADGAQIPALELKSRLPQGLYQKWLLMQEAAPEAIPCAAHWAEVPDMTKWSWLDRVLVERMEQKTALIEEELAASNQHWEETCYRLLCRSLGGTLNAEPFGWLARSAPLSLAGKYRDHLTTVEALLFGQAGMLEAATEEEYPQLLQREYRYLRQKHQLTPMPASMWKFARLRPANFPTVRIAQVAMLLHRESHLFRRSMEAPDLKTLVKLFESGVSDYWKTHYRFGSASVPREKHIGTEGVRSLVINTIAPLTFVYGRHLANTDLQRRALQWLEALPAERNHVIDIWEGLGFRPENAAQTQALLQLHRHYCSAKQCLRCSVGAAILK